MAEILIKNMEMPKQMESPITITVFENGSVWMNDVTFGKGKLPNAKAIELPLHGRLIDADEAKELIVHAFTCSKKKLTLNDILWLIDNAPIVLEASK